MLPRRLLATASFRSRGATLDRELCWHLCKKTPGEEKDMETNETLAASVAAIGNFSQPSDLPTQILLNHPNNTEFMVHSVVTVVSLSIVYGLLSLTAFVGNMLVIWVICKFHIFLIERSPDAMRQFSCVVQSQLEEALVLLVSNLLPELPADPIVSKNSK